MNEGLLKVIGVIIFIVVMTIILVAVISANAPQIQEHWAGEINAVIPGFDTGTTFVVFGGILAFSYLYYRRRAGQ